MEAFTVFAAGYVAITTLTAAHIMRDFASNGSGNRSLDLAFAIFLACIWPVGLPIKMLVDWDLRR